MNKSEFIIGKPRIYPDRLVDELKKLFVMLPNVKSAYIAQIFVPTSGMPAHPVIGIDMEGNLEEISDKLGQVIEENSNEGECIDVVMVNAKGLAEYFATIEPFYKVNVN